MVRLDKIVEKRHTPPRSPEPKRLVSVLFWNFVRKDLPMDPANRPLSPHLQIYRPQITSVLSILHRISGVGLGLGTLILAYWLISVAAGPEPFDFAQHLIGSPGGILLLVGWTFGLLFHFCNGIRHLFWDAGYGYELSTTYASGWVVIVMSGALTAGIWLWVLMAKGAA